MKTDPIIGSAFVSLLVLWKGDNIRRGIDSIARSIDAADDSYQNTILEDLGTTDPDYFVDGILNAEPESMYSSNIKDDSESEVEYDPSVETPVSMSPPTMKKSTQITGSSSATSAAVIMELQSTAVMIPDEPAVITTTSYNQKQLQPTASSSAIITKSIPSAANNNSLAIFDPFNQIVRLAGAVATLGSGCSLGPEGPSVEIGAGWSRIISGTQCSPRERHHLFLAGTAAGVAAGFGAPITGVFFALECGNRYLSKNTIKLDQTAPDGPRADIAAIVIAAALADIIVGLGLHEKESLAIQGNSYAMISPFFELPLYMGLGLLCGAISVAFTKLRDIFAELFAGNSWGRNFPLAKLAPAWHPLIGGIVCGIIAVFFPQTLFVGYVTLDQLMMGKIQMNMDLLLELLGLKLVLSSFSLGSGLIGGVFAPSLFFGAAAGTAYHDILASIIEFFPHLAVKPHMMPTEAVVALPTDPAFFSIANAPAYATVGSAATLGALFRAPLTSSMLMFELTQNHDIVLPVLVSTGLGGLFAELLSQPRRLW